MTDVIYHEYQRLNRNTVDHSYLIDVKEDIEIQQVMEYRYKVYDSVILKPPHPKTRFFEVVIRESRAGGSSQVEDLQVYPVVARKKPDFCILGIRIRKGNWVIEERIFSTSSTTEIQWIYTDDFHLFAITHAEDEPDAMVRQIVAKIDEIAESIRSGYRIYSHLENRRMRRDAFDSMMEGRTGITINKTAILRHPEFQLIAELGDGDRRRMQDEILKDLVAVGATLDTFGGSNKITAKIEIPEKTDITHQISRIEELQDLGWLFE